VEFSGVDNLEGRYRLPITRYDTSVGLLGSRDNTTITEDTFEDLDTTSLTSTYGIDLRQPIYQTANQEGAGRP
jgi:hemolysin activation/secretion protein